MNRRPKAITQNISVALPGRTQTWTFGASQTGFCAILQKIAVAEPKVRRVAFGIRFFGTSAVSRKSL